MSSARESSSLRMEPRCEPGPGRVLPLAVDATSFTMLVDFACGSQVRDLTVQRRHLRRSRPGSSHAREGRGAERHPAVRVRPRHAPRRASWSAIRPTSRVRRASFFVLGDPPHSERIRPPAVPASDCSCRAAGSSRSRRSSPRSRLPTASPSRSRCCEVVTLPDRLVEAVIALLHRRSWRRKTSFSSRPSRGAGSISFGFGLVHGFGFSSALRELGLPAHGLLLSLFGFNAGVELGPGPRGGRGPAGLDARADDALAATRDLELVAGHPARRRDPLRGTGILLSGGGGLRRGRRGHRRAGPPAPASSARWR